MTAVRATLTLPPLQRYLTIKQRTKTCLDIMDMEVGAVPSARKNDTVTEAAAGIAKTTAVSSDTGCSAPAQTANR